MSDRTLPAKDVHIHADGQPLTINTILFPLNAGERVRLGFQLGVGLAAGVVTLVVVAAAVSKIIQQVFA